MKFLILLNLLMGVVNLVCYGFSHHTGNLVVGVANLLTVAFIVGVASAVVGLEKAWRR